MYHVPVMLQECIEALQIVPQGNYADFTFGGGGHSRAIADKLTTGKLYAFDQDDDAAQNAKVMNHKQLVFIRANFRYAQKYLRLYKAPLLDGILADLGISSHQIDTPDRGFSTRFEGELDMRMDTQQALSAKKIINSYNAQELHRIFGMYGEVRNAKTVAEGIVRARATQPIQTTTQLKTVLQQYAPRGAEFKYFAQIFQALRIEVNDELKALEEMLLQTAEILKPNGRLVILTYHSLEDRLVKNFIQKGKFHGEIEKDIYGNFAVPFTALHRKPIEATEAEIIQNNRARSAKLRVAIKS